MQADILFNFNSINVPAGTFDAIREIMNKYLYIPTRTYTYTDLMK